MKKTMYVLAAVALLSLVGTAPAVIVNQGFLSDFTPESGNSFTVGGIEFSNFVTVGTAYGALPVNGESIAISSELEGDIVALRFNGGWSANSGEWVDTTVDFMAVSSQDIAGNALTLTSYGAYGSGTASITENVTDFQNNSVADKMVIWSSSNQITVDTASYPAGTTEILIHKDIYAGGGVGTDGSAHISGFSQGFLVPEPITLALLGLGGLVIRRKR